MSLCPPIFELGSGTRWVAADMFLASMNLVVRHASGNQARDW